MTFTFVMLLSATESGASNNKNSEDDVSIMALAI